jgi:Pyocin activator protein PrtN
MRDLDRMSGDMRPNTAFLLMAQYNGAAIVPLELVCRDYFRHLTAEKLLRKALAGQIKLPIVRIEDSQKAARGVHLSDLAEYIDRQRAKAIKECAQLSAEYPRSGLSRSDFVLWH